MCLLASLIMQILLCEAAAKIKGIIGTKLGDAHDLKQFEDDYVIATLIFCVWNSDPKVCIWFFLNFFLNHLHFFLFKFNKILLLLLLSNIILITE